MSRLSHDLSARLTNEVLSKLRKRNITSTSTFLEVDSELIAQISGLHFRHVLKVKEKIIEMSASQIRTGLKLYNDVCEYGALLQTGISTLDHLLDGGFMTGHVYEVCGSSPSGKSQLCMMVAANISARFSQDVFYIDTKKDFSTQRVASFLTTMTQNVGGSLNRIAVSRPQTPYDLLSCLHEYLTKCKENKKAARLLIIDSLTKPFYELSDNKEYFGLLSSVASVLQCLAAELHLVVLVTNVMSQWQGADAVGLGSCWHVIPQTRISLKGGMEGGSFRCLCAVIKSFNLPKGISAKFAITNDCIV